MMLTTAFIAGVAVVAYGINYVWPTTAGDREKAYRDAVARIERDAS